METGSDEAVGESVAEVSTRPLWQTILMFISFVFIAGVVIGFCAAMARSKTSTRPTMMNTKRLATSWQLYAADANEVSCPAAEWNVTLAPYYKDTQVLNDLHLDRAVDKRGIGINPAQCGVNLKAIANPDQAIIFGLTKHPGKDAMVTKETLRSYSKDLEVTVVATADGRAFRRFVSQLESYQWSK